MFKKLLIATVAVVLGLTVVSGTRIGSHLRLRWTRASTWVQNQVPPETEIARLRMELENLSRADDTHYDKVARLAVDVEKVERDVQRLKGNLSKAEARIRKLREQLGGNTEFVVYEGSRYSRDDLRVEALAFQTAEESLKVKEGALQAKKKHLALERKKLTELKTVREEMSAELQRLETALMEERQVQAQSESTIDDSAYRKMREEMDSVRDRIEILKKKRELRGELRPTATSQRIREQDVRADKYLETRFGKPEGKEVVSEK